MEDAVQVICESRYAKSCFGCSRINYCLSLLGARSSATGYARPPISERLPYADETKGVYMKNRNLPGQPLEWVRPDKVGTQIESGNVDIMRCARDAAYLWWLTGEEKYGRMAARVLDTYLQGIYYRDVPVDLNHGHQQTLVGMTSFEVIHEDIVPVLCECYDFLYDYMAAHYADRMPLYADALKKMADVIIRNGVPHNNWNIIQARFVFSIALVLDDDAAYEDGKGRNHYIDVVANDSTLRQWGLKTLADYGFDEGTGIWNECAGYSCNVVHDYTDFVMLFDKYLGRDLAKELPIIERAVAATPQYCFPNRKIVGFGDTHPWLLRTSYFANMVKNAQRYGKRGQEEKFTAMLRCFGPEFTTVQGQPKTDGNLMNLYPQESLMLDTTIAPGRIEAYVSPTFYVPKVSWLVQRNGMDPAHSLMYSLNASEGNHQHALRGSRLVNPVHCADDSYGPGHIPDSDLAGHQHSQAVNRIGDPVSDSIDSVFQSPQDPRLHGTAADDAQLRGRIPIQLTCFQHCRVLFTIPLIYHFQCCLAGMGQCIETDIIPDIDPPSVDLPDLISRLHSLLLRGISIAHPADRRGLVSNKQDDDDAHDPRQDQIEHRSRGYDGDPCPDGFAVKASLGHIIRVIFAHHAGAAEREEFDAELCPADLFSDQSGTKTQGKFIHPYSVCLCQKEMPQLMKNDDKAE